MKRQKSFENETACLYLVATPIGNLQEMTPRAIEILNQVDVIAAEDTRNTMKLLHAFDIRTHCIAHHSYNEKESAEGILALLKDGKNVAIVSDAGYPLISDPGAILTDRAVQEGFNVIPVSGSNAALAALIASGFCPQPFLFYGFLPAKENDCRRKLEELKSLPVTLIFYEAPHRIHAMLKRCLNVLGDRKVTIARELTKKHEEFLRGTLSEAAALCDELKGEIVVVIEGASFTSDEPTDLNALCLLVDEQIAQGVRAKEAIKQVALSHHCSKNELYDAYHKRIERE